MTPTVPRSGGGGRPNPRRGVWPPPTKNSGSPSAGSRRRIHRTPRVKCAWKDAACHSRDAGSIRECESASPWIASRLTLDQQLQVGRPWVSGGHRAGRSQPSGGSSSDVGRSRVDTQENGPPRPTERTGPASGAFQVSGRRRRPWRVGDAGTPLHFLVVGDGGRRRCAQAGSAHGLGKPARPRSGDSSAAGIAAPSRGQPSMVDGIQPRLVRRRRTPSAWRPDACSAQRASTALVL